ncbi:MAG: hypothetical protein IH597_10990 [Bacteroidales bacterium]|nr:hypothetical protein [Bacteroidales bacterium]
MDNITIDKFKELATVHEPHCISIFIPAHKAGQEVNQMLDKKNMKNQVKRVRARLESYKLKNQEIDKILQPVVKLVENNGFWKQQSNGLAVFRNASLFHYFTLPVEFEENIYVADHFNLKPLMPYLNDNGRFYILSLSLGSVKLFECHPHRIEELVLGEMLPKNMEEVVGSDMKEKNLQFRTGQTGTNQALFHGHGAGKEDGKEEIIKYFRAINEGVLKVLQQKSDPLIVAAVDFLVPLYREVNAYKNLENEFIAGNPEHEQPTLLHEKARLLLKDYFNSRRKEKSTAFEQAISNEKASVNAADIIPAAVHQRIDTLFICKGSEMWGTFDEANNEINIQDKIAEQSVCLLNMAAVNTILNNGTVFFMDPEKMPDPNTELNAIFRF